MEEAARKKEIDGIEPAKKSKGSKGDDEDEESLAAAAAASRQEEMPFVSRVTEADEKGDVTSLRRRLDETLFLVYKDAKTGQWRFPTQVLDIANGDTLHKVAPLSVTRALGESLDIWMVTNMPVGLVKQEKESETDKVSRQERNGRCTFY